MSKPLAERVQPGEAALVVVDGQNDFGHPDGALSQLGVDPTLAQQMLPRLVELVAQARTAGVPVFFTRYVARPAIFSEVWFEKHPPNICGSEWGADYLDGLGPIGDEVEVIKDRYSCFRNTDLDLLLRAVGARTVLLTGIATNVCVETAAREAVCHDYAAVLIHDCCASPSQDEHDSAVRNVERYFGWIAEADEVVAAWGGRADVSDIVEDEQHFMKQWDGARHGGVRGPVRRTAN
jgi:ureidoacrylate peracid hydrolase